MARLQFNKSALAREQASLQRYRRFLPSLDLKRQQLMAERAKAEAALDETRRAIAELRREVAEGLPMLANRDVDLSALAQVRDVVLETENLVGTELPRLAAVKTATRDYALMTKPHWVDAAAAALRRQLELRVREQVEARRLALLDEAVRTITQRVNLFDKVLIPRTRANIRRIRIFLSDQEMAAVVRSKIAKRKHAEAGEARAGDESAEAA
ncbi:ATP synthase subunit D [Phormidium willei BDU 130791]|nr:ATP synthase subunit D [Phormidium willei BDU 130791]